MRETKQFLDEYIVWSTQQKFDDFKFIKRLTKEKQEALLNNSLFNGWAIFFGPFYYMYLGLVRSVFYIILSLLFFSFGVEQGFALYLSFSLLLSLRANHHYLRMLKRRKEKYLNFNPDADTPYFNISNKRLLIASLLTGGIYLMYWVYKNAKAMKIAQQDAIKPVWQAVMMAFTSINVFRAIAHSAKLVGYKKILNPTGAAWGVLFLLGILGVYDRREDSEVTLMVFAGTILFYWIMLILTTLLFVNYQKAISFYAEQKNFSPAKTTGWERVILLIGILLNGGLIFATAILIFNLFFL